jgi:DmsE family decaheme c-type cytochrome
MEFNRGVPFYLLLFSVVVFALSGCVFGSPKGVGKACLDCHADFRQRFIQGVVHRPVKEEKCGSCHRNHGLIGGAYLSQPVPVLCFSCHGALGKSLAGMKNPHQPVQEGKCSSCHESHNASAERLLKAASDEVCFSCHERQLFDRENVHQPVTEGCKTCHQPHGSNFPALLTQGKDELCQRCHKVASREFQIRHGGYPLTTSCTDCHSIHSSDQPALLRARVHAPLARGECRSCHADASAKTPFAVTAKGSALCYGCHTDLKAIFADSGVHPPAAKGECADCHQPHAGDYPGMVKSDPAVLCFDCHQFKNFGPNVVTVKGLVHTPAVQGNCLACHQAHVPAAGQPALLAKSAEKLCQDCHSEIVSVKRVSHAPAREGRCMTCHLPHESEVSGVLVRDQRSLCGECHQLVDQEMGRPSLHRPFVTAQCSACHNPHGANEKKLLLSRGIDLCMECHQNIAVERKEPRRHRPFVEGRCDLCHAPHAGDQPFLLTASADALCVSCHAERKVAADTPSAHRNCAVCHHAHGNNETSYLLQEQPALCLNCHKVNAFWEKGIGHSPAVKGECGICHDPHSPQKQKPVADLCSGCHDLSPAVLGESHQAIIPGRDSCLQCHDAHGGPDRSLTLPVKHAPFSDGDCKACHSGGKR